MDKTNTILVPKMLGADIELANFILGMDRAGGTGFEASRALLHEVEGISGGGWFGRMSQNREWMGRDGRSPSAHMYTSASSWGADSQDYGRKWLPSNGGCVYIDLNHLELAIPEVCSARQYVAAVRAMFEIARRAQIRANGKLPGRSVQVLANNSDGQGNSYGGHMNILVSRRMFDNLFAKKLHHLLYLAAYQASSIIFTGSGKVGAENDRPPVYYQISQRADFFEQLCGVQTTHNRPIVNSRDESLCGGAQNGRADLARLHCIFYDTTLCQAATYLRAGVMQIVLAMIEAERICPEMILDDPVDAVVQWSHDPSLKAAARLASGEETTAVDLQLRFLEQARSFQAAGDLDGMVPEAEQILDLWSDTLEKLKAVDYAALAPRLDWVLKLCILQEATHQEQGVNPESLKYIDHLYHSLDRDEGLFWIYEKSGFTERIVSDGDIDALVSEPPGNTRAWLRAKLLRRAGTCVDSIDWDEIKFSIRDGGIWHARRTLDMHDPLSSTRRECRRALRRHGISEVLDALSVHSNPIDESVTDHREGGDSDEATTAKSAG